MPESIAVMDLNPLHLLIILAIILVLFGGSRIKEIMGGLGSGVKEFKKGLNDDEKHNPTGPNETVTKDDTTVKKD